jgi:hypothetical protein
MNKGYKIWDINVKTYPDYFEVTYVNNERSDYDRVGFSIERKVAEELAKKTKSYEDLKEKYDHLNDITYELEQNLLAAEDQNHYFRLMSQFRDENYDLRRQIELLEHKLKVVIENGLGPDDLKPQDV